MCPVKTSALYSGLDRTFGFSEFFHSQPAMITVYEVKFMRRDKTHNENREEKQQCWSSNSSALLPPCGEAW